MWGEKYDKIGGGVIFPFDLCVFVFAKKSRGKKLNFGPG